jgi:DNA-binding transcriptional MocR family regulator
VLHESWPAAAETITVVDGAMDALDQLVASVLRYGDRVAVENPCFPPLLDLLEVAGAHVVGVDVDESGPVPGSLRRAVDAGVRMLFCQPRAQNPTGASMTSARGRPWPTSCAAGTVVVVENDSAGAVAAAELVTLAAHCRAGRARARLLQVARSRTCGLPPWVGLRGWWTRSSSVAIWARRGPAGYCSRCCWTC